MKIVKKELISIELVDIVDGVLTIPKNVKSIADNVINEIEDLEKVVGIGVTSIGNYNFRYCNALTSVEFPLVTSIGNYNFTYCNALTSVEFPLVTSIGNYNFTYCNALTSVEFPLVTSIGNDNFRYCNALTSVEFKNKKLNVKSVDGYLFVIQNKKTTKGIILYTGYNLYSFDKNDILKEDCFLSEKDGFFAHGDTIKKSISDLQFKLISEKIKNEPILPETIITVMYYRTVTGACELGCKDFIKRNSLEKEEYRADELLPILEKNNAYGVEKFKSLINW